MKKTQIIKEIVGKRIEPYGFQYLKTDGPCRIFIREVKGLKRYYDSENNVVEQYINIQESNLARKLIVRLSTDVCGRETVSLKERRELGLENWVDYTDEETYRDTLNQFADLIVNRALGILDRMSVEEEVIPTKAMAEELFQRHKELDQMFINEYHMKAVPEQVSDIEEWQKSIKEILLGVAEQPYEEVKELLVKTAAFLGERLCDICDLEWMPSVQAVGDRYPYPTFLPLTTVVIMWETGCSEQGMCIFKAQYIDSLKKGFLE